MLVCTSCLFSLCNIAVCKDSIGASTPYNICPPEERHHRCFKISVFHSTKACMKDRETLHIITVSLCSKTSAIWVLTVLLEHMVSMHSQKENVQLQSVIIKWPFIIQNCTEISNIKPLTKRKKKTIVVHTYFLALNHLMITNVVITCQDLEKEIVFLIRYVFDTSSNDRKSTTWCHLLLF